MHNDIGWVDVAAIGIRDDEQRMLYSKLIIDGDQVQAMLNLEIQQDLVWKVHVKGRTIDASNFMPMLPYHANSLGNL